MESTFKVSSYYIISSKLLVYLKLGKMLTSVTFNRPSQTIWLKNLTVNRTLNRDCLTRDWYLYLVFPAPPNFLQSYHRTKIVFLKAVEEILLQRKLKNKKFRIQTRQDPSPVLGAIPTQKSQRQWFHSIHSNTWTCPVMKKKTPMMVGSTLKGIQIKAKSWRHAA